MNRLKERYQKEIVPALYKQLDFTNVLQVPTPKKVVVNIGLGEAMDNPRRLRRQSPTWCRSPAKSRL